MGVLMYPPPAKEGAIGITLHTGTAFLLSSGSLALLITATHMGSVSRDPGRGCPGPQALKQQDCEDAADEGHPRLSTLRCCSVTPQSVSTADEVTLEPETAGLNCCRVGAQAALRAQPAAVRTDPGESSGEGG